MNRFYVMSLKLDVFVLSLLILPIIITATCSNIEYVSFLLNYNNPSPIAVKKLSPVNYGKGLYVLPPCFV
jgi:hypothetical protein